MFSDIIYLNVGGVKYTTSRSTLTKYTDSMLGSMFSQNIPMKVDKDGCYFIDRNGKIFEHILQFLRSGELILPENFENLKLLKCEAEFFQILPLLNRLKIQEKNLQDYHKYIIKDQKIKTICLTAIYVDISNHDFDRYDLTYFICQKVNSNVYDIIYKNEHERFENSTEPDEPFIAIDSKDYLHSIIDDSRWKIIEEDFDDIQELLSFLISTGFSKSSFQTLSSCGEELFSETHDTRLRTSIQLVCYDKSDLLK